MSRGIGIVGEETSTAIVDVLRAAGAEWIDPVHPGQVRAPEADRTPAFYLVLSEAAMRSDGEIFASLRAVAPHVPRVLLVSPATGAEVIESAARHGMDDCLFLPLDEVAVAERLSMLDPEREPRRLSARLTPKRVLLAGDSHRKEAISEALQHCGHRLFEMTESATRQAVQSVGALDLVVVVTDQPQAANTHLLRTVAGTSRAEDGSLPPLFVLSPDGPRGEERIAEQRVVFADIGTPLAEICNRVGELVGRSSRFLRVEQRVPFFCAIEHREAGRDARWEPGFSYSISQGGIFVHTLVPLRAGAPIEVRIRVPTTGELIDVTGVVAWSNAWEPKRQLAYPVGMAVQFLGFLSREMTQLIEICRMLAAA